MFGRKRTKTTVEVAPSGSPIYRYGMTDRPWQPAARSDDGTREAVDEHIVRHLGTYDWVWHEIVSDLIHVDVMVWTPTDDRPFYTLMTEGMSDLPMNAPPELVADGLATSRAELMLCLPADWPVPDQADPRQDWTDTSYWPVAWLKLIARLPHEFDTWVGYGHTVPNGEPAEPFSASTHLVGWALLPPQRLHEEAHHLELPNGELLEIFGVVALHPDELTLKLEHGVEAIFDGFDERGVNELLNASRGSTLR